MNDPELNLLTVNSSNLMLVRNIICLAISVSLLRQISCKCNVYTYALGFRTFPITSIQKSLVL